MTKIAIIGAGQVGSAAAYALVHDSLNGEILLVDNRLQRRDGQVNDLCDAVACENSSTKVRAATYKEASQADIVVIAAGLRRMIGETTIQSLERGASTLHNIIKTMKPFRSDSILLIVSNPVEVLTTLAQDVSGLPRAQVFGAGTLLDSVRLRRLLADRLKVAITSVNACILGGHSDSQFVAWSLATIDGVPIEKAFPKDILDREEVAEVCRREGQRIIEAKGAIAYGIGSVVATICSTILLDKRQVLPVSHYQHEFGCCLSLPVVVGRGGIDGPIDLPLFAQEMDYLKAAGQEVLETVRSLRAE